MADPRLSLWFNDQVEPIYCSICRDKPASHVIESREEDVPVCSCCASAWQIGRNSGPFSKIQTMDSRDYAHRCEPTHKIVRRYSSGTPFWRAIHGDKTADPTVMFDSPRNSYLTED